MNPGQEQTMRTVLWAVTIGVTSVMGSAAAGAAPGVARPPAAKVAKPDDREAKAQEMISKAIAYLRTQQDEKSGGWGMPGEGSDRPVFPAITALVVSGMVMSEGIDAKDPAVAKAAAFMLEYQQPDGGIYDRVLPSYNTAIALSALAKVNTPEARAAIPAAQEFLRKLQWSEASVATIGGDEAPKPVDKSHPFYGGIGYGQHGRPDLSNLNWMLQGLHDSGVPSDDPAFQRALVFLQRVQMHDATNDMAYADGSKQGGFIYATSVNKDDVGGGQSQAAGTVEETLDDGTKVSRLRAYGSMTYAGFKSYLYAGLKKDDPRVQAAREWIAQNYTLEENPHMGTDGLYYYFVTFARAMEAFGEEEIETAGGEKRRWADDLIDRLAELQNEDGSFRSVDDRWMENDPVLITAYSLLALQHAVKDR
jgi:squalene-hopene/tetraprenyl-beta-curcumene cyclase